VVATGWTESTVSILPTRTRSWTQSMVPAPLLDPRLAMSACSRTCCRLDTLTSLVTG